MSSKVSLLMSSKATLVLRLAAPLQSWGTSSRHNYRNTAIEPSKAGVIGLLSAAQGMHRGADLSDLKSLTFAVRADQPGRVITDFHTVSALDGSPLPSAKVNAKGVQAPTSPKKYTYVTRRQYLEDAVYVAMVEGDVEFVEVLAEAVRRPVYPLFLGRRSCVPSEPLIIPSESGSLWREHAEELLQTVPWQAGRAARGDRKSSGPTVTVTATIDDPEGDDLVADVPLNFAPGQRGFSARRIRHLWVTLPTGAGGAAEAQRSHDPFSLLGGAS